MCVWGYECETWGPQGGSPLCCQLLQHHLSEFVQDQRLWYNNKKTLSHHIYEEYQYENEQDA